MASQLLTFQWKLPTGKSELKEFQGKGKDYYQVVSLYEGNGLAFKSSQTKTNWAQIYIN